MVIDLNRGIQYASNKGEIPFVFTYVMLLISAIAILVVLSNIKIPNYNFYDEFYSCFLNSYEGKIKCSFPHPIKIVGNGNILTINGKKFYVDDEVNVNCSASKFEIYRGDIKCGTS